MALDNPEIINEIMKQAAYTDKYVIINKDLAKGKDVPLDALNELLGLKVRLRDLSSGEANLVRKTPSRVLKPGMQRGLEASVEALATVVEPIYSDILDDLSAGAGRTEEDFDLGILGRTYLETPGAEFEHDDYTEIISAKKKATDWKAKAGEGDLEFYIENSDPLLADAIPLYQDEAKKLMQVRAEIEKEKTLKFVINEDGTLDERAMRGYLIANAAEADEAIKKEAFKEAGIGYAIEYSPNQNGEE